MTPEAAFAAGSKAVLKEAYVASDAYGEFLCGKIYQDSQQRNLDGEAFQTSYLVKKFDDEDVWLTRTGVTYFVTSWRQSQKD